MAKSITTVDDVARSALSAVNSNAGLLQAIRWTSERYRQLSNRVRLRATRKVEQVVIPAPVTAGTASFTRGSVTVTGDATAQAAWTALQGDQTGVWWVRYKRNWYAVDQVDLTTTPRLILKTAVAEDNGTSTAYKLVQRHTRMPEDMRFIGGCVHQRLWRPLSRVNLNELDMMHPERLFVAGTGPEMFAEVGDDRDGVRLFEFYPYSTASETILFSYFARSAVLEAGDPLPDDLDIEALRSGIMIDIYRFEMAKALRENKIEAAAIWRNELRAQETTWEDRVMELAKADRSSDDISVILNTLGPPVTGDLTFIRTARQDAITRIGNWP